jgi:hypothetical protein
LALQHICNSFYAWKKTQDRKKNMKSRSINPNQHRKAKMNLEKKIVGEDLPDLTNRKGLLLANEGFKVVEEDL